MNPFSPFSQIPAFRILQVPFRVLQIPAVRDLHILFRVLQIPSFTDSAIYIFHSIPQFTDSIPFREIQTPHFAWLWLLFGFIGIMHMVLKSSYCAVIVVSVIVYMYFV